MVGEPVDLWDFLRTAAVAGYAGKLTREQLAFAVMVALDSEGGTGTEVTVQEETLGAEFGISRSQVWRMFKAVREAGWFEQTADPKRGRKGRPGTGRKARYRTTVPPLDLGRAKAEDLLPRDTTSPDMVSQDSAPECDTIPPDMVSRDAAPGLDTMRGRRPYGVALSDVWRRASHAETRDSSTSNGHTSEVVDLVPQLQDTRAREAPDGVDEVARVIDWLAAWSGWERGRVVDGCAPRVRVEQASGWGVADMIRRLADLGQQAGSRDPVKLLRKLGKAPRAEAALR